VPKSGGSVKLYVPIGTVLGNPLTAATREMSSIYGLIFESLIKIDDTGAPSPCLAETWSQTPDGEDSLSWTFTLRSDVKWHSGRLENAGDVIYTLKQIKALDDNSPYNYVLNYIDVDKCKANTDGTVTIALKNSFYGALHALTFPIVPSDGGYDGSNAPNIPIGTGPYKVTNYVKDKTIDLVANTDWWRKQPYITKIQVQPFQDNATAISSLVLRQLDAVQTDDLTVSQYRDSGDANVYEYPTRYFEYMALNFSSSDIKDKSIRQALAYAIDRREIVSYTYVNHAIVSDTPVPPDSWLYDGKMLLYNNDVAKARSLIALAGWKDSDKDGYWDISPDGVARQLKFTLLTNRDDNNTLRSDAAALIAGQLDKAGIKVDVKAVTWDDYNSKLKDKAFDLALCGCYLSPVPDFSILLSSHGALNVGGYKSTSMDSLLTGILNAKDSSELKVKTGDLQSKVIDDLPFISLYFRTHSLLTTPALKNVSGVREDSAFSSINQWFVGN